MMKIFLLLFCSFLSFVFPCNAEEIEKKVDSSLGHRLIEAIYKPERTNKVYIDEITALQTFPVYEIREEYAVNPWTGDVWDMFSCQQISNPQIQKIQEAIKKMFNAKELKEYERLRSLRPGNFNMDPC